MISMIVSGTSRLVMVIVIFQLSGCYYLQAARGQMEILQKREPIDEVVAADGTSAELIERLSVVAEARQFSIDVLGLPDNDSYRGYADLERDYVVWNIVAVPEFSLTPKRWCYPVAGCVSYRGYFSPDSARRKADSLRSKGYDVAFGGVAAYSTLGKFSDPVLNTMMHWGDVDLVSVIFHELAHQLLYIKDDSGFNESFATAVEEFGMERWLESRRQADELTAWRERRALRSQFSALVADARTDLGEIYEADTGDDEKRGLKHERLLVLADDAKALFMDSESAAPAWLDDDLNNARLASTTLYHGRLPEFKTLLAECDNDLACFYDEARRLADE
ncbi:MAG: aminopeptidase [Gammaproteobacteria bacterium]|nr:MAG: aminopeptidase [Gammaproteobacteria bacterium]